MRRLLNDLELAVVFATAASWLALGGVALRPAWAATPGAGDRPPVAEKPHADAPSFFPLQVGVRWSYSVEYQWPLIRPSKDRAVATLVREQDIRGKRYHKMVLRLQSDEPGMAAVEYYRQDASGLYRILGSSGAEAEHLLLPLPVRVGKRWRVQVQGVQFECRVVGKETIEAGGVKYEDCYHVSATGKTRLGTVREDQWVAHGVGVVKKVQTTLLLTVESVLTSYAQPKAP